MVELITIPNNHGRHSVTLSELPLYSTGRVASVRELGFVNGEDVRLVARGPIGGEPLLVQVGFTRFALRIAEAARVELSAVEAAA